AAGQLRRGPRCALLGAAAGRGARLEAADRLVRGPAPVRLGHPRPRRRTHGPRHREPLVGRGGRLRSALAHLTDLGGGLPCEPATDGSSIVFSSRGRLFAMASLEATPREVEVLVSGVGAARVPRPASPSENLLAMRPLHDARASVVEWRGSVHALTHRGGPSRLLAGACGLRLREARPLGRTPFALFVSDAEALADREEGGVGSDVLALARLDGGGEEIRLDVG